jgi:hypothetical protein
MTGEDDESLVDIFRLDDENVRRNGLTVAEAEDERRNEVVKNLLLLWLESRICCSDNELVTPGCCNNRNSGMLMRLQENLDLMLL